MLRSEHRLKHTKDIERVFKKGRSVFDAHCGVRMIGNGLKVSRYAIVIGSKVSKSAVERNRIRRQYREILRKYLAEIAAGKDIILLPSRRAIEVPFAEKEAGLVKVLKKAGLLKG